jgi:hypothetical protein
LGTPSSDRWSLAICRAISKCRATLCGVRLIEIGLVERIDHRYYMTAKANAPLQREVLLAHLHNMQAAIREVSNMDPPAFEGGRQQG